MSRAGLSALLCALAACAGEAEKPALSCPLTQPVKAADRKIIGTAAAYPADPTIAAREAELRASQRARRQLAWQIVARTVEPVALAEAGLPGGPASLPRFRSWYAKDDVERLFRKLWHELGFSPAALDAVFAWDARSVEELPTWPEERYLDYLATIDESVEIDGVAGAARVAYAPATVRHLLAGHRRAIDCLAADPAPAWSGAGAATRPPAPRRLREQDTAAACAERLYGPFLVAPGTTLTATLSGDGDADLYLRAGAPASAAEHDCASRGRGSDESCTLAGPGPIWIAVAGYAAASDFTLEVDYAEAESAELAACLDGPMPRDAAIVKSQWSRSDFGDPVAVYDTSAARLAGRRDWGPGDGYAHPGADEIYTVRLPTGAEYRMTAMHIMTKELDHWVWITLWWSPDPDGDFGADRPTGLPGVFANYKMCVVTDFDEHDPDPRGGFAAAGAEAELGDALAAVHRGAGGPSWCSNPYLELGDGNAETNCIGCHQHAGARVPQPELAHGGARRKARDNFPADYLWSLETGDALAAMFQAEVDLSGP